MGINWRDEIIQLLSVDDLNIENIKKAKNIKFNNIPKSLYKFRDVSEYSLGNLRDSTLYLSTANTFNDPYDSAINFDPQLGFSDNAVFIDKLGIPKDEAEKILSAPEPFKEIIKFTLKKDSSFSEEKADLLHSFIQTRRQEFCKEQLLNTNAAIQNSYKICSLSERLDSLPMWAHYAADHKGFVMEYDFNSLSREDILLNCLWPVYYTGIFDASGIFKSLQEGKKFNNLAATLAALHKSPDWKYEAEWRIVLPDGNSETGINLQAPLKAVYLGTKLEDSKDTKKLSQVLKWAKVANVPVFRIHLIPEEFRVEAVPF